ncbi:hypothetical protein BDN72DRAFT_962493 [Pluteus cervinus]|uniref:Uncharacterized protein n=1 Tax=Pluteus cervinus TaxID=181527 RepID=A0ACD3AJU0_9AGAR|nr:hypothetical protein BDN72DRAFT_962493 [Pluteus cervinus]
MDSNDIAFARIDEVVAVLKEHIRILANVGDDTTALEEAVRVLHASRNEYTYIHRLPQELLAEIFYLARHIPPSDQYGVKKLPSNWVAMSQVSQQWRDVALGSSNLWAHISSSYPRSIIQECLKRSEPTSLTVDWYCSTPDDAQFFRSSLHRVKELTLVLNSTTWNTLSSNLSSPAPKLELLYIFLRSRDAQSPAPLIITDSIFSATTPCLQQVHLSGCSIHPEAPLFTGLTSLGLYDPPQRLSAQNLFSMLRSLPHLSFLGLSEVLEPTTSPVSANITTVALPTLRSLLIRGQPLNQYLEIISLLSFPRDSTIDFRSMTGSPRVLPSLLDFLRVNHARWSTPLSTPLVETMDLDSSWGTLQLSLNPNSNAPGYVADLMKLELRGEWGEDLGVANNTTIISCFSYLPLSSLTSLTSNWPFDTKSWANPFGALPNLKSISVKGQESLDIIEAIVGDLGAYLKTKKQKGTPVASSSGSSAEPLVYDPIFPKLEELHFAGPTFCPWLSDNFVTALRVRKEKGKGLSLLEVKRCEFTSRRVMAELSEVLEVKWDGFTGRDDDDDGDSDDPYEEYEPDDDPADFDSQEFMEEYFY